MLRRERSAAEFAALGRGTWADELAENAPGAWFRRGDHPPPPLQLGACAPIVTIGSEAR